MQVIGICTRVRINIRDTLGRVVFGFVVRVVVHVFASYMGVGIVCGGRGGITYRRRRHRHLHPGRHRIPFPHLPQVSRGGILHVKHASQIEKYHATPLVEPSVWPRYSMPSEHLLHF